MMIKALDRKFRKGKPCTLHLLPCVLLFFATVTFAQSNNTSSPYTRYGYGQLSETGLGVQRGMGGIGYGLRNSKTINTLNPAAYSAVDSLTFMLDLGLTGQVGWFKENGLNSKKVNAGLDYLAIQFPLAKGLGLGLGLEPISYVGYQYADTINGAQSPVVSSGQGGFSDVYATLSYKFSNRFSAGIKLGYVFGTTYNTGITTNYQGVSQIGNSSQRSDTLHLNGLTYELGLQYSHLLPNKAELTVGAIYSPKIKLQSEYSSSKLNTTNSYTHTTDAVFELPETYGLGVAYRKKAWTVGADGKYQRWADAQYLNKKDTLQNRLKLNIGAEYAHKLIYRAGAYYSNSYVKAEYTNPISGQITNSGFNEYGVSLGVGIPMVDRRSFVNLAFEYAVIRPEIKTSLDERYFKVTVSYTFNELWFYKRKLQ